MTARKVLEVKNLVTYLNTSQGPCEVIRDISFDIYESQSLGLVGESGSGKSITALSLMRLIESNQGGVTGGQVLLQGQDLLSLSEADMCRVRGRKIAMIFQEPMSSLNPVLSIGTQVSEVLMLHQGMTYREAWAKSIELLHKMGVPSPVRCVNSYPHSLSGGMRQRVMIAMALACDPAVLVADEPTTALDVTIQAQILDLLRKLQQERGMGILFITHDLGVVAEMCQQVAVMYAGRIVEQASTEALFSQPKHPYTQGLLKCIPTLGNKRQQQEQLFSIPGHVPRLHELSKGCSFRERCGCATQLCKQEVTLDEISAGHRVACFHPLGHPPKA